MEEARYKKGCVNWNQVIECQMVSDDGDLLAVLHQVHHGTHQPLSRGHLLRQHRAGLGCDISGHLAGGLDGRDVFCSRRSLILELDILRLSHSGK